VLLAFDCFIPQRYPCGAGGGRGQEERLRLAVLESEDLAVATDVELTL
jgi:hypothetical protein